MIDPSKKSKLNSSPEMARDHRQLDTKSKTSESGLTATVNTEVLKNCTGRSWQRYAESRLRDFVAR
jgi:hypothetical protein